MREVPLYKLCDVRMRKITLVKSLEARTGPDGGGKSTAPPKQKRRQRLRTQSA